MSFALEADMNDWHDIANFVRYRHDELNYEADLRRLTAPRRAGQVRITLITLAVILLGMIAWWGR